MCTSIDGILQPFLDLQEYPGGKPEGVILPVPFQLRAWRQKRSPEKLFILNLMIFKSLAPDG